MPDMLLQDKALIKLLKQAYSAEKAAAFAYQGHAGSVSDAEEKREIHQIEVDEWNHRSEVLKLMGLYGVPVSKWYEVKNYFIGKTISAGCYLIGWFMPFYFAGNLESGNVCEYIRMKRLFNAENITAHDEILYEMSLKEKEHEVYFYEKIAGSKWLPFFEKIFAWGNKSKNDIDLEQGFEIENTNQYCKYYGEKK
jgi:rubrerythrin